MERRESCSRDLPLGVVTRFDAALLAKRADEMFVSVPAWENRYSRIVRAGFHASDVVADTFEFFRSKRTPSWLDVP